LHRSVINGNSSGRNRLSMSVGSGSSVHDLDGAVTTMIGCLPTQALAFLAVFVYATHATQAIAFEWKPGLS